MKMLGKLFLAIGFSFITCLACASPDSPKNGVDYLTLENPQPSDAGDKVEVMEFFGYFCSHCYGFDASLIKWMEKQNRHVTFKRVHINFNDNMALQQRLFYTLSAMGKLTNSLHHRVFDAIQVKRTPLRNERQIGDFVQKMGIDRNTFLDMYRSFTVQSLCDGAVQMQSSYQIDGVPTIVIDGRYVTSLAIVSEGNQFSGSEEEARVMTMQVMDNLVARILKERQESRKNAATAKNRKK
ncbi:thiol:disulfide interchange protein DsbA/DsbL [Oxalobacter sp. OttesenSCG-928-P03]|nr:thiol:disulfide interchange protein DsbA/DsbL [Oxalobacter sp. OttesenSCG-928-P03]